MQKHILTRDVLECLMLTASSSSWLSTLSYIPVFHSFFFFSPESDIWNSSREQIWGLRLHIYALYTYAQHINKHIGSVPHARRSISDNGLSWLITVSLSIPSLPLKWSSSRPDEQHVKEHMQQVSTTAVWTCWFNLNNSPRWEISCTIAEMWCGGGQRCSDVW